MFDIGWGELLVIAVVALVVIGPKELPGALRTLGQFMGKVRRMAGEFQQQFHEAMREAELADLKKEVDEMAQKAANFEFDPVADVRREFEDTQHQIETAVSEPLAPQEPQAETTPAPSATSPTPEPTTPPAPSAAPPAEPAATAEAAGEPEKPDAGGRPA